ncbi:MAG: NepR family anti-sigma factor [Methylocystis sp.]|uniref:NepR family anti-sigma factor n=1 Tax=Methylocystis sp. TaxID=1911079 RepID=UPI003D0B9627
MTPQTKSGMKRELKGELHLKLIGEQLRKNFASVVAEPLPSAMLDLLDALDQKPAGSISVRRTPYSE